MKRKEIIAEIAKLQAKLDVIGKHEEKKLKIKCFLENSFFASGAVYKVKLGDAEGNHPETHEIEFTGLPGLKFLLHEDSDRETAQLILEFPLEAIEL